MINKNVVRPNAIDWAKALGMCSVILGHYVYYFNIPYDKTSLYWQIAYFVTLFHMPLFFIISGILYNINKSEKVIKLVKTLLLPYILICTIVGIFYYSYNYATCDFKEIIKYIIGIASGGDLYGKANIFPVGPLWFCYSLFTIKIMILICKNRRFYFLTLIFIALVVMFVNKDFLPFRLDSSLVGFLFFYLGYCLKSNWKKILTLEINKNLLLLFISSFLMYVFFKISLNFAHGYSININYYGNVPFLFIVSGVVGTVMILSLSRLLAYMKLRCVYVFSVGMIIPLGFQKVIMICLYHINPAFGMEYVSIITVLLSYLLILFVSKHFPLVLGGRKIE